MTRASAPARSRSAGSARRPATARILDAPGPTRRAFFPRREDVRADVIAGAIIPTVRPFRADRVSVAGLEGLVKEIDMRRTTLETADRRILVPNSTVLADPVSVLAARGAGRPA